MGQCVRRLRWESHLPLQGSPPAGTAIRSPFLTAPPLPPIPVPFEGQQWQLDLLA